MKMEVKKNYEPSMRKYCVVRNRPLMGFQDVLEVTKTLEEYRASSEKDPINEVSQQTS